LESIIINSKLSLVEFRDGKTTSLNLSRKGYGNQEAIIIGALLQVLLYCFAHVPVQTFTIVSNPVSPPGNRIFCFDSLQENNTLQKLDLYRCGISDVGVAALADGLKVGFQFIHRRCILKIATHMLAHTFGAC